MEDCLGTKARQGLAQDWGQVVRLDLPWGQLSTLVTQGGPSLVITRRLVLALPLVTPVRDLEYQVL